MRVLFDYEDNYLYVETAMFGSAAPGTDHTYLAFYRRTGGVDTLLSRLEDFGKPAYFDLLIHYGPDKTGANVLQACIDGTIVAYYGTMQLIREVGPPQNPRVCLASGATAHTLEFEDFICIRRQGAVNDCIPDQYQLCNWTPGDDVTDAVWEATPTATATVAAARIGYGRPTPSAVTRIVELDSRNS